MNDTFAIQTLSVSPRLYTIDDFIDDAEIEHVLKLAQEQQRLEEGIETHQNETGFSFEMPVGEDTVLRGIRARIATLIGFENDQDSTFRFRRYAPGESHPEHLDTYELAGSELIATAMIALVAPERGGETLFPRADGGAVAVRPRRGRLVLWYNHAPDGNVDEHSSHSAARVEAGEKTTITAFIYKSRYYAASAFPAVPRATEKRPKLVLVHAARRQAVFRAWINAAEWVGFETEVFDCREGNVLPDADVLFPVDFSNVVQRALASAYRDGWNNVFLAEPQLVDGARLRLEQRGFPLQRTTQVSAAEKKLLTDEGVRWLAVADDKCVGPEAPSEANDLAVRAVHELGARTGVVIYDVNESGAVLLSNVSAPVELSQLPQQWWSAFCLRVLQGMIGRL